MRLYKQYVCTAPLGIFHPGMGSMDRSRQGMPWEVSGLTSTYYEDRLLDLVCLSSRRGDTKQICAWSTKSFSKKVAWRRHALRWQETVCGQLGQGQGLTHWTFEWHMEDWTCDKISSAWEWLRTGIRFLQKWEDCEKVRFLEEPTNSWELTSCAAPNGE